MGPLTTLRPKRTLTEPRMALPVALVLALVAAGPAGAAGRAAIGFQVTGVEPGQRAIDVSYSYGGCQADPRASAREGRTEVRLAVTVRDTSAPGKACSEIARIASGVVTLRTPLHGRTLLGGLSPSPFGAGPGACGQRRAVPSVVGMAVTQARTLLRLQGFQGTGPTGIGRVTRQRPAHGATAGRCSTVRLTVRAGRAR